MIGAGSIGFTRRLMRDHGLATVCEEAACPNIGECWKHKHATFMIMGETCTRACAFCNVATGKPGALNPHEPASIGDAVGKLGLELHDELLHHAANDFRRQRGKGDRGVEAVVLGVGLVVEEPHAGRAERPEDRPDHLGTSALAEVRHAQEGAHARSLERGRAP